MTNISMENSNATLISDVVSLNKVSRTYFMQIKISEELLGLQNKIFWGNLVFSFHLLYYYFVKLLLCIVAHCFLCCIVTFI